jgi:cysteine-rich repeat protein
VSRCGDGYLNTAAGEVCDDGNMRSGDGCSADCSSTELCGNGILNPGEDCDDGNTRSGDGCSADCRSIELCGNGIVDIGETCDTAGASARCDPDCTLPLCGDGLLNVLAGEQCDDGNLTNGDGCESNCTRSP